MTSLVILLALTAGASTVSLDGARFFELREPDPVKDDSKPPTPWASKRTVIVTPDADGVRITATWAVDAPASGWFDEWIVGPGVRVERVTIDGRPAAIAASDAGTRITAFVTGATTITLDAFVDGDAAMGMSFLLMPAVRGTIRAERTPLELVARDDGRPTVRAPEGLLAASRSLQLWLRDPAPLADKPPLFVAEVATGLTVRDGDVEGHARVTWLVRQGELSGPLSVSVRGAGPDVTVIGANVQSWSRSGDLLVIEPDRTVRDAFTVDLAWSVVVPSGDTASVPVPEISPTGAFRIDGSLLIARDDAIEIVPELGAWQPVAANALPEVAAGLITGTPTSAWRGQGAGSLTVLRVSPIEQPAAVVDVASLTLALNDEGRVLMRGYYTVRNERAPALRIVPPPGVALLGVQVSGKPITPGKDDGEGWLVPLPRSLETVDGLLSFPIEVVAFGTHAAWERAEERDIALFRVDAPVAVQRVTLHLPPGYRAKSRVGEHGVVASFTEGETLSYGLAVGDVAAAEVDAKFQEALDAWMVNDFETAQLRLDDLRAIGGESENVRKLQGNLDVVDVDEDIGVAEAEEDTTVARRVKDMARARATEEVTKREELIVAAKEAERAGDYEAAAESYGSAFAIGEKLAGLEQTESASFRGSNMSVMDEIEAVDKKVAERSSGSVFGTSKRAPSPEPIAAPPPMKAPPDRDADGVLDGHDVPLVDLGETPSDTLAINGDDGLRLAQGQHTLVLDLTPPTSGEEGNVDFLMAGASYVTGLDDGDLEGVAHGLGGISVSGSGMGGGGSGYGVGYGAIGIGREYVQSVPASATMSVTSRQPGLRIDFAGRGPRGGKEGKDRGYRDERSPLPKLAIGGEEPDEPVVTAQSLSIIVPDLGETLLYQSVLLPEETTPSVRVIAKRSDRGEAR